MFHNHFGEHERVLLPFWHEDWGMGDDAGNLFWADHEDNVLVVVIAGAADGSWSGPHLGQNESRFYIGDGSTGEMVTVQRTTNELVIIAPNGSIGRFPLPPGVAKSFHEEHRFQNKATVDLFTDLRVVLDAATRRTMDKFLTERRSG